MIKARHEDTTNAIRGLSGDLAQLGWYHSIELPDGNVIPGLQKIEQLRFRAAQFPIPKDLSGKRVLDIGAWDGWFSFEMERRGASVLAVDATRQKTFLRAKELLDSKAEYLVEDVCRLSPQKIGYFDVVLFFGVLYHVKHPLLALERVCALTTDMACIESLVTDDPPSSLVPLMEFYEGNELAGQYDNWTCPNTACLLAFCRTAGFARVELNSVHENRAHVTCYRKWPDVARNGDAPELVSVENTWTRDHSFATDRDDYITVWFKTPETDLTPDNVFLQIGPYGCRPLSVAAAGAGLWQANGKLSLGLVPGWHDVSVSVRETHWSNRARIPVDLSQEERRLPAPPSNIIIDSVRDGKTYEFDTVHVGVAESSVSAWASGVPDCPQGEVSIRLDGADLPATYVSTPDARGVRQINAMVPMGIEPGEYIVSVRAGQLESKPLPVLLVEG